MKATSKMKYLALLRGINVGGNNIIKMTDLKSCFEAMGFGEVETYIQSGNVMFTSEPQDNVKLTKNIQKALSDRFQYTGLIVVITLEQLETIVKNAPKTYGDKPEEYRYDLLFLKEPLDAASAMKGISIREGVDTAIAGEGVLYFSRLISKAGQSYLTKVISLPMYKYMTIRNWNTTSKLLALMTKI